MANFIFNTGTLGFLTAPFNLMTTELNALASAAVIISSVNGTSGVFSQTNTVSAIWGYIWFKSGGTFTPTGAPSIAGWYIKNDGSGNYEKAVAAPSRAPDFQIPFLPSAYASADYVWSPLIKLWEPNTKTLIQNLTNTTLPATGNTMLVGVTAITYA